jgi:hypothetical protein
MQNAIANTIIQGSERHATSDEEISLFQSFISKYGFDLIGQKSQAALRRLEACTNLNKLARKEVDAYIGPTRNQLPFNIQRSETLYWAWSNVTYELTRPVERRVSQRVASGTRGGANTHGSMTTNFESTTERDNRVENHGTGYLGITDKALYFVATTPGGQSVEVPFDRLLNFSRNSSSRVGFQESARQGDARHPRSFSGADAWEIDMAFRTLTRSAEVTDDERRQAWRDLSPPVQSLSHNENEDASSMSYLESIRKGTREGWGKGYRFGRGR